MGMTQHELAQQVGVSLQQVQKYECASSRVSAGRLHGLATALNVPVQYFFSELSSGAAPDGHDDSVFDLVANRGVREMVANYAKLPGPVQTAIRTLTSSLARSVAPPGGD